jgi:prolyl oligopeptidase
MESIADPIVQQWFRAQADYTTATLARIPGRDALLARLTELDSGRPFRIAGIRRTPTGRLYYTKLAAGENVSKLYVRPSADAPEQLLVDPSAIPAPDGGHWSLSFYSPSPDHRAVIYGLAASGSEQDVLHVLDVATGKDLPDVIDRIDAGYTDPQWLPDGRGFVYERRRALAPGTPETEGYRLTAAFRHELGTDPAQDTRVFAKDLWPNVDMTAEDFPSIVLTTGSKWAIGKIKHGDSNPLTLYAAPLGGEGGAGLAWRDGAASPWVKVCDVADSVTAFAVHGDEVWLVSAQQASAFKVVRTPLARPDFAHAAVVLPAEGLAVVDNVACAKDAAYVTRHHTGASEVLRIGYAPGAKPEPLAAPAAFPSMRVVSAATDVDGVVVGTSAWTRAGRTYAYDPAKRAFTDTQLSPTGPFDNLTGYESVEVEVPARDGAKVPLSIVYKKGLKRDGSNPTLLTGYGSYGLSLEVGFRPTTIAWLERGGVYAVAHVRGGGEKGEAWHLAGQKLEKPNTWRDFIDCAEYLVKQGYTSPGKLAGQGGSAGGITIGRAVTERPDLFAAALFDVGALNTLRAEFTMNGVPNIPEFGTVTDSAGFRGLYEMDTYQHVKDGVKYPAVMLSHGINDPRVNPWESGKTAARLQAATASGKPVLLRIDYHAGHGIGSTRTQALQATADKWAFLLWQMGILKPLP